MGTLKSTVQGGQTPTACQVTRPHLPYNELFSSAEYLHPTSALHHTELCTRRANLFFSPPAGPQSPGTAEDSGEHHRKDARAGDNPAAPPHPVLPQTSGLTVSCCSFTAEVPDASSGLGGLPREVDMELESFRRLHRQETERFQRQQEQQLPSLGKGERGTTCVPPGGRGLRGQEEERQGLREAVCHHGTSHGTQ